MKIIQLFESVNHDQLLIQFGSKLIERFQEDRSISDDTDPEQFIKDIDAVNPTNKHEVSQWIVKTYVDGGINLYEDMSRVNHALQEFYKWRNQLEVKNLHLIDSLSSLENMVKPFTDNDIIKKDNHIKSEQERIDFAKETTDILYDGADGKIIWPRTKGASCYYGEDTHWCISATRSKNYFNQYTFKEGYNLLFLLPNDGSKWAFLFNNNGELEEIYDSDDHSMSLDAFMEDSDYKYQDLMAHMPEDFHIDIPEQHDDHKKMKPQDVVYLYSKGNISDEWIETHMSDMSINYQLALVSYEPELIKYIKNPSEVMQLDAIKQDGHTIIYIEEPSLEVQLTAVNIYGHAIKFIKDPSLEVQLAAVKKYSLSIEYIKDPSIEVQIAAVNQDGLTIRYIDDPSIEVQIAAVKQNGYAIQHIKEPTIEVRMTAVKQNGYAIQYIKEPSLEVKIAAVKQDGYAIEYIKDPSLKFQLAAVKRYGFAIQYIDNPSIEVQLAAVKKYGLAIKFIDNPSIEVQLAAVKRDGSALYHIKNPSIEVQLTSVNQYGLAIQYINDPFIEVQLAAVKQDGYVIRFIKDPSLEVQLAAVKQDGYVIRFIKDPYPEVKEYVRNH